MPNEHNPINQPFAGSQYHHLHIMNNHAIGLYIPKELHRGVYHNSDNGKGMREINNQALVWLTMQDVIFGQPYNPNTGLYKKNKDDPNETCIQRFTHSNVLKVITHGKPTYKESFNDAITRVLDEYEEVKKENKKLKEILKGEKKDA